VTRTSTRTTRAERLAMPLAREIVKDLAVEHGACIRPVQLRRTNLDTGTVEQVLVPCGHTLASVCPACAQRAKTLRAAQCREGWHLEAEPVIDPDSATEDQKWWIEKRAEAQVMHDQADEDVTDLDALNNELDQEITAAGMRGNVLPARPQRRHRTTRRRQDAAPLPRRKIAARTIGKTYNTPDGKTFRPSMLLTLTCPSYGRVRADGTPADPATYDYQQAARDALHFAALFDRFIQNLRRFLGYDVQYFAAIEPQRRLAPHIHLAMRGTVSRTELRRVLAATYHQVWWPDTSTVRFDGDQLPVWDEQAATYLDPATGEVLPTWDDALDAIGDEDEPLHVARFGDRFDAQGVLAGSKDAARCIGYLTKYLAKHVADCHQATTDPQRAHVCGTASSPRTPAPAWCPAPAKARPTSATTSATPDVASWSPASGPERRWPTTGPTARNGCWPLSARPKPTPPATPGNRSPPATPTTWNTPDGSCTWSPTASDGKPRSLRRDAEPALRPTPIFRQPGGRHDHHHRIGAAADRRGGGRTPEYVRPVHPPADRRTADRVRPGRPSRADQRGRTSGVHRRGPD
jgi:hypothetical protein